MRPSLVSYALLFKRYTLWLIPLFFLSLVVASCQQKTQTDVQEIVARVGPYSLLKSDVELLLKKKPYSQDSLESAEQHIERWIQDKVLLLECERLNLSKDPQVAKLLTKAREEVLIQALEERLIQNATTEDITDAEMLRFYEQNPSLFILNEQHLLVEWFSSSQSNTVNRFRDEVFRGKNLENLINEISDPQQRAYHLQEMEHFLSRTAFNDIAPEYFKRRTLSVGDVSTVYTFQGRSTFVRIKSIKQAGVLAPFNQVKDKIEQWLRTDFRKKNLSAFKRALYLKASSNNQIERF
jgi:hypothetical protein